MKKLFVIILIVLAPGLQPAGAQIPDDTDGRLYRLCKTWGYFKYFSQHKCELKWDTLLNTTVNQVLAANDNEEFNAALMAMFNKVGNNSYINNPYPLPDTNLNFDDSWIDDPVFSTSVQNFLDTFSVHIYPDTSSCLVKLNDYSTPGYYSYIDFRDDPLSMAISYTNEANRLTTMFYYWNVINYFAPNRYIMDQTWDSTLVEFIPLIRQASTNPEFHITFLQLATKINDSHGFTSSSVLTSFFWGGNNLPKLYLTRVDTHCVVTKVEGIAGVSRGDILVALKGILIKEIEDSLAHYIPASTPAALYRDMYYEMLKGTINSSFEMTLLDSNNNTYTTIATRTLSIGGWYSWRWYPAPSSSYYITTCGYGYVDLGWLDPDDAPAMYEALKDAPVIIFDIRSSPYAWLTDFAHYFFIEPITSAIWHDPALSFPVEPVHYYMPGWYYIGNDSINLGSWSNPDAYNGKVYLLVNGETQSSAEYTCQYLSYHPNSRVFGTQTAGADGPYSEFDLPGGLNTCFTSMGWYYADGYQQQRNGVKIDTVVSPTVEGIRHGEDEILLAALDCLTGVEEQLRAESVGLTVYPNPASRQLTVGQLDSWAVGQSSVVSRQSSVRLSIVDLFGREIIEIGNVPSIPYQVDISSLPDGMYILKIINEDETIGLAKFLKISDR